MNSQDNKNIERRGIILSDNVDLDWLRGLEPKYNGENRIKFDVNIRTNKVCVGMDIHASTFSEMGREDDLELLGGFIRLDNGMVEYDSTVNIALNMKLEEFGETPRQITNEEWISRIDNTLFSWVTI